MSQFSQKLKQEFETKDLVVTSYMIPVCHEVSEKRFFIDYKNGKGVADTKCLDEAIGFAKIYQKTLA